MRPQVKLKAELAVKTLATGGAVVAEGALVSPLAVIQSAPESEALATSRASVPLLS